MLTDCTPRMGLLPHGLTLLSWLQVEGSVTVPQGAAGTGASVALLPGASPAAAPSRGSRARSCLPLLSACPLQRKVGCIGQDPPGKQSLQVYTGDLLQEWGPSDVGMGEPKSRQAGCRLGRPAEASAGSRDKAGSPGSAMAWG